MERPTAAAATNRIALLLSVAATIAAWAMRISEVVDLKGSKMVGWT